MKWNDISKYRSELFGLAIISIILLHYFELVLGADYIQSSSFKILSKLYTSVIGSVGVDIFIFLSGFGIYYSLKKSPAIADFFRKRFNRVIIPYLILGTLFWIIRDLIILKQNILTFVYDFSLLSFWFEGERAFWYVSLICCLYIISPIVYSKGKVIILAFCLASVGLSIISYFISPSVFYNIEIALCRIPLYFLGMICAELSIEYKAINEKMLWGGVIAILFKGIAAYQNIAFARLFNGPYSITLILAYVYFRNHVDIKIWGNFLILVGKYSLELYIAHVSVRAIMNTLEYETAKPLNYFLCIMISIVMTIVCNKLREILKA